MDETIVHVHAINQHLLGSSWIKNIILKDLNQKARLLYSAISDAKKGVITAIQYGEEVKFFLYIRLSDESIVKHPINMQYTKADSLRQDVQLLLKNGHEKIVEEIV